MKKIIYSLLLAVLPVMAMSLASCSDDKDLPDVNVSLDVQNATIVDGTIYVVQGDTLNVTQINVKNNEAGKGAAITNVKYYLDGFYIGQSVFSPYPAYGLTDAETPVGSYDLGITCTVLASDKSIAVGVFNFPFKVVKSASDIPSGTVVGQSATKTVSLKAE